jgi:formate dehydrogenase maturation protein FdhE
VDQGRNLCVCNGGLKIPRQHEDLELDPVADNAAPLVLDLRREAVFYSGVFRPFLPGD